MFAQFDEMHRRHDLRRRSRHQLRTRIIPIDAERLHTICSHCVSVSVDSRHSVLEPR